MRDVCRVHLQHTTNLALSRHSGAVRALAGSSPMKPAMPRN